MKTVPLSQVVKNPNDIVKLKNLLQGTSSTENHITLDSLIQEVLSNTDQDKVSQLPGTLEQFIVECGMYVWGQYVLHGSIDQDSPLIGRNLYKNEDNTTIVNDYFIGEVEYMVEQFVTTRLEYV